MEEEIVVAKDLFLEKDMNDDWYEDLTFLVELYDNKEKLARKLDVSRGSIDGWIKKEHEPVRNHIKAIEALAEEERT